MTTSYHPITNIDRYSQEPVYYMAHPVAPDDKFTYQQNMDHILEMMKFLYVECNIRCVAPYHTMCLVLPEHEPIYRKIGLEVDLVIVRQMRKLILVGHKISTGMRDELTAASESNSSILNFVGWKNASIKQFFDSQREARTVSAEWFKQTRAKYKNDFTIGWQGSGAIIDDPIRT